MSSGPTGDSFVWGRVSTAVKLVPQLVQHVNAGLVLGDPEDELGALRGCEDSLTSSKIVVSQAGVGDSLGAVLRATSCGCVV